MAIRLVILAGIIALPLAIAGIFLGGLSIGQAALLYLGAGWTVIIGGALGYLVMSLAEKPSLQPSHRTRSVIVEVRAASGP